MKLANDTLIMLIEIFRQGILEGKDISDMLRQLELEPDSDGKLTLKKAK